MISESDLTIVGKVAKTHGVDGEMSVTFYDPDFADSVEVESCVLFKIDGIIVPFFVNSVRPRGSESLLLSIEGEDTQQEASFFVGKEMYMRTSDLPESEEDENEGFFAAQLIGFKAMTDEGVIGEIIDIDDSTDNPLFIVEATDGTTKYLPIVDEFITDIDVDAHTISFDLPEGLLEL